jgi:hypothetical protein
MNSKVFMAWISEFDRSLNHPIILWVDNFSGHKVPDGFLKNIRLEFFKANLTAHVQPCNAGIIYALKCHYRKQYLNQSLQLHSENVEPSKVFKIDVLTAMRLSKLAWHSVSKEKIKNCWRHSGIVKFKDDDDS